MPAAGPTPPPVRPLSIAAGMSPPCAWRPGAQLDIDARIDGGACMVWLFVTPYPAAGTGRTIVRNRGRRWWEGRA